MANAVTFGSQAAVQAKRIEANVDWRVSLWMVLLCLTAMILVYPVNLRLENVVTWSSDVFPNILILGTVFFLWTLSLLVLLFTCSEKGAGGWERVVLVAVAALVFRGYWSIIAPFQGQAIIHALDANQWTSLGHVGSYSNTGYYDWPGASMVLLVLNQVTGLGTFAAVSTLAILTSILVGIATYTFLLRLLGRSLEAALASILIIAGNLAMTSFYTAGPMAIPLVILFLGLLAHGEILETASGRLTAISLVTGAALIHFHTSMNLPFFLLGIWTLSLLGVRYRGFQPALSTVLLFFIIPIAWIFYWGVNGFNWMVSGAAVFLGDPLDVWARLQGVATIGAANFGPSAPAWYSWTRLLWLCLLYAAGGLAWLWFLKIHFRLKPNEGRLVGAFGGLGLLSLLSGLVSPRGFGELLRGLTYVPFFTTPFLFIFFMRLGPRVTQVALPGIAVVFALFSFPTFLGDNRLININMQHQVEFAQAEWLQSLYGTGEGLNIFGGGSSAYVADLYYLTGANYTGIVETESSGYSAEMRRKGMDDLLTLYSQRSKEVFTHSFFVHSPSIAVESYMTLGLPLNDPLWLNMIERLSRENEQVYDNGALVVYAGIPKYRPLEGR